MAGPFASRERESRWRGVGEWDQIGEVDELEGAEEC